LATIDFKVLKSQGDWDTETASIPTAEKSPAIKATTADAGRDTRTASYHCDADGAPAPTQSADDHDQIPIVSSRNRIMIVAETARSYPSK
jgi:hypothetical protein